MLQPLQRQVPRSSELTAEREALEEMVRTQGWGIFIRRVQEEWSGNGYHSRMGTALTADDPVAAKVVHKTSNEVLGMIEWPKKRIQYLGGKVE